jgi:hypothetical protein
MRFNRHSILFWFTCSLFLAASSVAQTAAKSQDPQEKVKELEAELRNANDPQFALVLGLGSLLLHPSRTDYVHESNVLHATNLGPATPQLMAGVSFRTELPSPFARFRGKPCSEDIPGGGSGSPSGSGRDPRCQAWKIHPWSAFVSLKFSPSSSEAIDGYVLGGSFSITRHLDILLGFALSPVNEPGPGFRTTAARFVREQLARGEVADFSPEQMLANSRNAFDGFGTIDAAGRVIFVGEPLAVRYRGSVIVGVSIPIYFRTALSGS